LPRFCSVYIRAAVHLCTIFGQICSPASDSAAAAISSTAHGQQFSIFKSQGVCVVAAPANACMQLAVARRRHTQPYEYVMKLGGDQSLGHG